MLLFIIRVFAASFFLLYVVVVPVFADESPVVEPTSLDPVVAEPVLIDLASMTLVGKMTTIGVQATAYIVAIDPTENLAATHRLVLTFVNKKSGVKLAKGLVGIKWRKLFGAKSEPVWMRSSKNQPELFVAEISLIRRGTYLFIVGSKLEDDKKRQFTFEFRY